jgi:hypothetical protein
MSTSFLQLRARDYDAFLALGFAPKYQRDSLAHLVLFMHDMCAIRARASEPMLADIKLAWWREALEDANLRTQRVQPDIQAFAAMMLTAEQRALLLAMVDAAAENSLALARDTLWHLIALRLGDQAVSVARARDIIHQHRHQNGQARAFSLLLKLLFAR